MEVLHFCVVVGFIATAPNFPSKISLKLGKEKMVGWVQVFVTQEEIKGEAILGCGRVAPESW